MKNKEKQKTASLYLHSLPSLLKKEEASHHFVLASDDSHPTSPEREIRKEYEDQIDTTVYLTVHTKVRMSRRHLSLVSGLLLGVVCKEGINLNDLIVLEYLYSRLMGQKFDPKELKERRELEIALAVQSLLFGLKDLSLSTEKIPIPNEIREFIESSSFIPNQRTMGSWNQKYSIHKFLIVRTVSVDRVYEKTSNSIPYDSYCKGYGESHPNQHKKKTKHSSDLDGEEIDIVKEGSISIPLLSTYYYIHYQELEMKYLNRMS